MSSLHKLKVADLETIDHLREWVDERLYGSVVVIDTNGEVVIRTGLGIDLGNYLYPLHEECDVCEAKPGEPHCSCGSCDCEKK
jgi:hypothetical protein